METPWFCGMSSSVASEEVVVPIAGRKIVTKQNAKGGETPPVWQHGSRWTPSSDNHKTSAKKRGCKDRAWRYLGRCNKRAGPV